MEHRNVFWACLWNGCVPNLLCLVLSSAASTPRRCSCVYTGSVQSFFECELGLRSGVRLPAVALPVVDGSIWRVTTTPFNLPCFREHIQEAPTETPSRFQFFLRGIFLKKKGLCPTDRALSKDQSYFLRKTFKAVEVVPAMSSLPSPFRSPNAIPRVLPPRLLNTPAWNVPFPLPR